MPSIISPQSESTKCNYRRPQNPIKAFELIGFRLPQFSEYVFVFPLKAKTNFDQ